MMKKATWIWKDNLEKEDAYASFFDTFDYFGGECEISLSVDGLYALYLNEELVAFGQYADYPFYKVFDKVSLSKKALIGKNFVRIDVWYFGRGTLNYYLAEPGLIYEITKGDNVLAYSSVNTESSLTKGYVQGHRQDLTWQLGFSHKYDLNNDYREFSKSIKVEKTDKLYSRPIKFLEIAPLTQAKLISNSSAVYDLGFETAGFIYLNAKIQLGKTLRISYSEHLVNGVVPWPKKDDVGARDFYIEIVGDGKNNEVFMPFRIIAGRYFQITCDGEYEIYSLGIKEVYYPVTERPFDTDNSKRKLIYETAKRTLHLCMHSHYEDCPWREQAYYSLDGGLEMLYGYYAFTNNEYQRANLVLMSKSINQDGMLSMCAPSSVEKIIPSFSLFFTVSLENYYNFSKDKSLLEELYPVMETNLSAYLKNSENGLLNNFYDDEGIYWNFYDWTEGLGGGMSIEFKQDLLLSSFGAIALKSAEKISKILDLNDKAEYYKQWIKTLNKNINKKFFDSKKGYYCSAQKGGMAHKLGNAYAILCGAATGKKAEKICELLSSKCDLIETNLSLRAFVYDALIKVDKQRYRDYILNEIDEIFGKMIDEGSTSFWETLDGYKAFNGAGSLCHGWAAMALKFYNLLGENKLVTITNKK